MPRILTADLFVLMFRRRQTSGGCHPSHWTSTVPLVLTPRRQYPVCGWYTEEQYLPWHFQSHPRGKMAADRVQEQRKPDHEILDRHPKPESPKAYPGRGRPAPWPVYHKKLWSHLHRFHSDLSDRGGVLSACQWGTGGGHQPESPQIQIPLRQLSQPENPELPGNVQPHGHGALPFGLCLGPLPGQGELPGGGLCAGRGAVSYHRPEFPEEDGERKGKSHQAFHPAACHERAQHPHRKRTLRAGLPQASAGRERPPPAAGGGHHHLHRVQLWGGKGEYPQIPGRGRIRAAKGFREEPGEDQGLRHAPQRPGNGGGRHALRHRSGDGHCPGSSLWIPGHHKDVRRGQEHGAPESFFRGSAGQAPAQEELSPGLDQPPDQSGSAPGHPQCHEVPPGLYPGAGGHREDQHHSQYHSDSLF